MKFLRSRLYDLDVQKRQEATRKLDESKMQISFGSQIRSYVMQPYQMIKDHRTKFSASDPDKVLDGDSIRSLCPTFIPQNGQIGRGRYGRG